jgi:hypothetical protein
VFATMMSPVTNTVSASQTPDCKPETSMFWALAKQVQSKSSSKIFVFIGIAISDKDAQK